MQNIRLMHFKYRLSKGQVQQNNARLSSMVIDRIEEEVEVCYKLYLHTLNITKIYNKNIRNLLPIIMNYHNIRVIF